MCQVVRPETLIEVSNGSRAHRLGNFKPKRIEHALLWIDPGFGAKVLGSINVRFARAKYGAMINFTSRLHRMRYVMWYTALWLWGPE